MSAASVLPGSDGLNGNSRGDITALPSLLRLLKGLLLIAAA